MKRTAFLWMILTAVALQGASAAQPNLYDRLSEAGEVKVYVAEPIDSTPEKKIDAAGLGKALRDGLDARKSISFEIVSDPSAADIRVDTDVLEYLYSDSDPVDMLSGVAAIAYDAATNEHYVRMVAHIKVTDPKKTRPLWEDKVVATITSNELTPESARTLINPDMAKVFIRNCFHKRQSVRP